MSEQAPGTYGMEHATNRVEAKNIGAGWMPIETAPTDGTLLLVFAPSYEGLPSMYSLCAYHPDAGFCIDELRSPSHWRQIPAPPVKP